MRWAFLIGLMLFLANPVKSQAIIRNHIKLGYANANSYSILHGDAFSYLNNQAALGFNSKFQIGLIAEKGFLLNELNKGLISVVAPAGNGSLGINAAYNGSAGFNENRLGLAYGLKLGERSAIGAQFNYNSIHSGGYGNYGALSFELAGRIGLTEKLQIGVSVNNPVGGKFSKSYNEKLPFIYTVGLCYDASKIFFIGAELAKEENAPFELRLNMQYLPVASIVVRAGLSTGNTSGWMGIGYKTKSFVLHAFAQMHQYLGISPGVMLQYQINKSSDKM